MSGVAGEGVVSVRGKELSRQDVLLLILKKAIEEGQIFFLREEVLEYLLKHLGLSEEGLSDEDVEALNELLDDFVIYANEDDSTYDVIAVLPKPTFEHQKIVDTFVNDLVEMTYFDEVEGLTWEVASDMALMLVNKYYGYCTENGDALPLYVYRVLSSYNVEPVKVEGAEKCNREPYTCDIVMTYPHGIKLMKSIDYCNRCINGGNENFIAKCTYIKFPEEEGENK